MKLTNKILSMVAIAGLLSITACSDDAGDDPDPVVVKTCQLTGIGETSDGDSWNYTYTYDDDGNLISRTDEDGTITFTYTDGKISSLGDDDVTATVSYDGNALPYRLDFDDSGDTFYYILKSENGRYISFESHYIEDGEDFVEGVTYLTYNSAGNVTEVIFEEYDPEMDEFYETGSIKNLTHDNNKNPYITSHALMLYEILDGDEANLGLNNPVTATYNYGTPTGVSNSYTYNDEGYPTKREETGFSTPTTYNFAYICK